MKQLVIYSVHPLTREFLGEGLADPDPLEPGRWLIPAHAFIEAPPEVGEHEKAVMSDMGWRVVADQRGAVYWTDDGERHVISVLGERVPDGALLEPPPPPPPTREEVEAMRLSAYADPVNGSDRYFSEAIRLQLVGDPSWPSVKDKGVARHAEIKAKYPWPEGS